MQSDILRKFFVKELPELGSLIPKKQERYFLLINDGQEERITANYNTSFFREKVKNVSEIEREKEVYEITEDEWFSLKDDATGPVLRKSYLLKEKANKISVNVYQAAHAGLARAEVNFNSAQEARVYKPERWMGPEITESPLGKDSTLIMLDERAFRAEMERVQNL